MKFSCLPGGAGIAVYGTEIHIERLDGDRREIAARRTPASASAWRGPPHRPRLTRDRIDAL